MNHGPAIRRYSKMFTVHVRIVFLIRFTESVPVTVLIRIDFVLFVVIDRLLLDFRPKEAVFGARLANCGFRSRNLFESDICDCWGATYTQISAVLQPFGARCPWCPFRGRTVWTSKALSPSRSCQERRPRRPHPSWSSSPSRRGQRCPCCV